MTDKTKLTLMADMIRNAVSFETGKLEVHQESYDFGHMVGVALTEWLASLRERGVLEIREPDSDIDHVKKGLGLPYNERVTKYDACRYFPKIDLPEGMKSGQFDVFWDYPKAPQSSEGGPPIPETPKMKLPQFWIRTSDEMPLSGKRVNFINPEGLIVEGIYHAEIDHWTEEEWNHDDKHPGSFIEWWSPIPETKIERVEAKP